MSRRLPEAEHRPLVVGALGEQPERPALGLVRAAARRPDPLDRGGDVIDAERQLHRGPGAGRGRMPSGGVVWAVRHMPGWLCANGTCSTAW